MISYEKYDQLNYKYLIGKTVLGRPSNLYLKFQTGSLSF